MAGDYRDYSNNTRVIINYKISTGKTTFDTSKVTALTGVLSAPRRVEKPLPQWRDVHCATERLASGKEMCMHHIFILLHQRAAHFCRPGTTHLHTAPAPLGLCSAASAAGGLQALILRMASVYSFFVPTPNYFRLDIIYRKTKFGHRPHTMGYVRANFRISTMFGLWGIAWRRCSFFANFPAIKKLLSKIYMCSIILVLDAAFVPKFDVRPETSFGEKSHRHPHSLFCSPWTSMPKQCNC